MKKKIFSCLFPLCLVLFVLLLATSCMEEPPQTSPDDDIPKGDDNVGDVVTELSEYTPSVIAGLFSDAIDETRDASLKICDYKLEASVPYQMQDFGVLMRDGVIGFIGGDEYYLTLRENKLLAVERSEETGGEYSLVTLYDFLEIFGEEGVGDYESVLLSAERDFGVTSAKESDFSLSSDGYYYLKDAFLEKVIFGITAAQHCESEGILPSDFLADEELKSIVSTEAKEVISRLGLKVGFSLKTRKIAGIRIVADIKDAGELPSESYESVKLDLTLTLSSVRSTVQNARLSVSGVAADGGTFSLGVDFTGLYNEESEPTYLSLACNVKITGDAVTSTELRDGEVLVNGKREVSFKLSYDPTYILSGGNLFDLSYSDKTEPEEIVPEGVSPTESEKKNLMKAENYTESVSLRLYKNEKGEGKVSLAVASGTSEVRLSGSFKHGKNIEVSELAREVTSLLAE